MNDVENRASIRKFWDQYVARYGRFFASLIGPVLDQTPDPSDVAIYVNLQSSTEISLLPLSMMVFERTDARAVLPPDERFEPFVQALQTPAPPGLNYLLVVTPDAVNLGFIGISATKTLTS